MLFRQFISSAVLVFTFKVGTDVAGERWWGKTTFHDASRWLSSCVLYICYIVI